jgi:drug/metabolite transporter (DMT)-like permease
VPRRSSPAGIGAAAGAVTAWGIGNVIIAAVPMGGLAIAFHRLWAGSLLYLVVLRIRGRRPSAASFRHGAIGGAVFGCNIATFFLAVRTTSVANAVTISALQPVVILGFAAVMFGERIRVRHVIASAAAVAGVAMVTFGAAGGGTGSTAGDLWAVLALLTWAGYFIASKSARRHLDTLEYLTVMNLVAFAVVAPLAVATGSLGGEDGRLTWGRFGAVIVIVLLPGTGHLLINWAHAHTTLVLTSLITLAMPVISTATAAAFLDQRVSAVQAAGIAVVLCALAAVIAGDARAGRGDPLDVVEPGT